MRRPISIPGFTACLDTPAYAHRLLDLQGYSAMVERQRSEAGLQRCQDLYMAGWHQREQGQLRVALAVFQELSALSRQLEHPGWISAVDSALQFVAAEIAVSEAIAPLAPEITGLDSEIAGLIAKATSLRTQGYRQQAMEIYREALPEAVENHDVLNTARCLNDMGLIYLSWQQYEKAAAYCRTATEALSEIEAPAASAIAFHNQGIAHYQQQQFEAALRCFQQALNYWQAVDDTVGVAITLDYLGRVYAENHDYWLALGSFEAAIDVLNELRLEENVQAEAAVLMEQIAILCERTQHFDLALAYWIDTLAIYQRQQDVPRLIETWHRLGGLYQQMGYGAIALYCYRQLALLTA